MATPLSLIAKALRPLGDETVDALGPVSPYQDRLRKQAQGIGSTSATTEGQEKAGKLLDDINYRRAMAALNRHK